MNAPELRRDPVIGRWVIIAPGRERRPVEQAPAFQDEVPSECPFCPGAESATPPEIAVRADADGRWRKRVFASRAPIVSPDEELVRQGEGMFDMVSGFGAHEVIVDSPRHDETLATMSPDDLSELVGLWRERILALKKEPRFRCITLYANRGLASGATIAHSHSQLIATPIMPRRLAGEISRSYTYFQSKERCIFCDLVEREGEGERTVYTNDAFVAITPWAPRFPYEMWILPRDHASHFEDLGPRRIPAFAAALGAALGSLGRLLKDPPYSFVMHSGPTNEKGMVHYHWHLEIMPRITNVAGFEWGTGFYINPISPEEAARALRQA